MKRIITLSLLFVLLLIAVLLTGCGEHTHSFSEWSVTKEATCIETGLKERFCEGCGRAEKEEIPLTEHTEISVPRVESTCSSVGYTAGKCCSVCNKVLEGRNQLPKKSHTFGEWEAGESGTCIKRGKMVRKCVDCDREETKTADYGPHKLGEWVNAVAPTNTSDGTAGHYKCTLCNKCVNKRGITMETTVLPKEAKGLEVQFHVYGTCTIIGPGTYEFKDGILDIPSEINGYPVRAIGDYAFKDCKELVSINSAFLSDIGKEAFSGCTNLTSVSFFPYVIKEGAFKNCTSLESINISLCEKIEAETFMNCTSLSNVIFGNLLQEIGIKAFMGCDNIGTPTTTTNENFIVLPDSLMKIDEYAFSDCKNLKGVIILNSTAYIIEKGVFANCTSLESVSGILVNLSHIPEEMFMNCDSLTSFGPFGNKINAIGKRAFMGCDNLNTFYLSQNISIVGEDAFKDCVNLKTVYDLSHAIGVTKGSTAFGYLGYYAENIYTSM